MMMVTEAASNPLDPKPPEVVAGRILNGRYRILRPLADGGVGRVFEGEQINLGERVAIKMLLSHNAKNPELLERFRREAEIVGSLAHPHIVQVFDVDETENGDLFMVLELLKGETLAELFVRERRIRIPTAISIASQIASALASTHQHGIVHRDLKPENVFLQHALGEHEFVKLLDFGISRTTRGVRRRLTSRDVAIGTPAYMAPEQARADKNIDSRVDQFALAVIVYEMLSGELPFTGQDPAEIMKNIVTKDPPRLNEVAPWVPSLLDAAVHRGLSREPADRFTSISQFAWALENAAVHAGVDVNVPTSQHAGLYSIAAPRNVDPAPTPKPSSHPPRLSAAAELLAARSAWAAEHLDAAVTHMEALFELAVFGHDPEAYEVLRGAMAFSRQVFGARVGDRNRRLNVTALGHSPATLNLSPKSAELLALAEGGATVFEILDRTRIPEHNAIRMLAGLLRRGALTRT